MEDLRSGIVVDDRVPFKRVGCYVWPKTALISTTDDAKAADGLARIMRVPISNFALEIYASSAF